MSSKNLIMKRFYFFLLKTEFPCIFKEIKTKRKIFRQSWAKNICTFFYILPQSPFTASETELDYCHQKVNVRGRLASCGAI